MKFFKNLSIVFAMTLLAMPVHTSLAKGGFRMPRSNAVRTVTPKNFNQARTNNINQNRAATNAIRPNPTVAPKGGVNPFVVGAAAAAAGYMIGANSAEAATNSMQNEVNSNNAQMFVENQRHLITHNTFNCETSLVFKANGEYDFAKTIDNCSLQIDKIGLMATEVLSISYSYSDIDNQTKLYASFRIQPKNAIIAE